MSSAARLGKMARGTDHGAAGPMFVFGEKIRAAFTAPRLLEISSKETSVIRSTSARSMPPSSKAGSARRSEKVLGKKFEKVPVV